MKKKTTKRYVVIDELYEASQNEDNLTILYVFRHDGLFAITVEKHTTVGAISFSIREERSEACKRCTIGQCRTQVCFNQLSFEKLYLPRILATVPGVINNVFDIINSINVFPINFGNISFNYHYGTIPRATAVL